MARDHIELLEEKIQREFTLLASVVLARVNRFVEDAYNHAITHEKNKDLIVVVSPVQVDPETVAFYDIVNGEAERELPSGILIAAETMHATKGNNAPIYGQLLSYLDKVHEQLIDSVGALHPRVYDLDYGERYHNRVGITVNLPLAEKTVLKLTNLSGLLLTTYPLDKIQEQIDGNASLGLPNGVILSALTIRRSKAECNRLNPVRDDYPQEYDIERINGMIAQVRQKIVAEEKATRSGIGE